MQEQGIADTTWVRFSSDLGAVVPNAILWALDSSLWPPETEGFWAHFGHSHGDLHPGNVLIQVDPAPRANDFRLIDLSAYMPNGSLAKDLAHLYLSVIGEHLSSNPVRRKNLLALALGDSQPSSLELRGLREVVARVRRVGAAWQASTMKSRQDDWNDQTALALVAGGLEFVGLRNLGLSQRLWFLQLSCVALGRYLERQNLNTPPADPATVRVVGPLVDPEIELAVERLAERCGDFKGTRSVVAVLMADLSPAASERASKFPWTAVMSFDPELDTTGSLAAARQVSGRVHRLIVSVR